MTPQRLSTQEYNFLIADMFDCLPENQITSSAGQALIGYFMVRFKDYVEKHFDELKPKEAT